MRKKTTFTMAGAIFCLLLNAQNGTEFPATFNGSSLQWTDYSDGPFTSVTPLSANTFALTYEAGARTMRLGGKDYNVSDPIKHPTGYVKAVDDMRANGFEPMIQVSYNRALGDAISVQASWAAEVVRQLNIVHKRGVRYFIIANEPGEDQQLYSSSTPSTVTQDHVRLIRDYVKKFSFEMKKVDPTIKIIAPGLEWHIPEILDLLFASATTGTNSVFSVRGTIGTFEGNTNTALGNLFFVDILSFHAYMGFGDAFQNFSDVRKGTIEAEYDCLETFQDVTDNYIACPTNTAESRFGTLKVAVDEYNFGAAGLPSSTTSPTITTDAKSANTFLAGQGNIILVASMLTAKEGTTNITPYEFSNLWSAEELDAWGFIENGVRKPTYWHYWLWANYFKGKFFPNVAPVPTSTTNVERGIKAYACEAGDYVAVLVMNMLQTTTSTVVGTYNSAAHYSVEINFNNTTPSTANTASIAFNMGKAGWANSYTYTIDNETTTLLLFNCSGAFQGRYDLRRTNMTSGGGAASYTSIPYTGTTVGTPSISGSGTVCAGSTNTIALNAPAGTVVQWRSITTGSSLGSGSTLNAGVGFYELEMQGGCGNYFLTAQVQGVSPYLALQETGQTMFCTGSSAALTASTSTGASVGWAPTSNLSPTTGTAVTASPSSSQQYTVSSTDGNSCVSEDKINVHPSPPKGLIIKDDAGDNGDEPNSSITNVYSGTALISG